MCHGGENFLIQLYHNRRSFARGTALPTHSPKKLHNFLKNSPNPLDNRNRMCYNSPVVSRDAGGILHVFMERGLLTRTGKRKNAYLYARTY